MCWLWLCLTGIQRPAPLSPVTRPCWAAAKASCSANNGAGLYTGLEQTADCPLVLIHPYSVPSRCCRLSLTHTYIHRSLYGGLRRKKKVQWSICWYVHTLMRQSLSSSVCLSFCWSLPSSLCPPSIQPSIHPSLPTPGPLHPLSLSLAFFLFVIHADSVARSLVGPNSQSDPQIASDTHLAPHSSAAQLSQPHGPRVGCSIGVFPPSTSCCGPCVSVCVEYSESPGRLPPMQVRTNKSLPLLHGATQPPWEKHNYFVKKKHNDELDYLTKAFPFSPEIVLGVILCRITIGLIENMSGSLFRIQ